MERDEASILDALIFAQRILEFTSGLDEEMFANDLKTQAAVLYKLVHDYEEINLKLVWSVIQKDIPELIAKLNTIISLEEP